MEWYTVLAIVVLIILAIALGILLACMLAGQRCTVAIQQRKPNHELTQIQQEEERKRQKRFSSKLKRTFRASPKQRPPLAPVEDVKTIEFSFKMGDAKNKTEVPVTSNNNDSSVVLLPLKARVTQEELDERQKKREAIRKKYNL